MTEAESNARSRLNGRVRQLSTGQLNVVAAGLLAEIHAAPEDQRRDLRVARLAVCAELDRRNAV